MDDALKARVARRLKARREQLGMTQEALAQQLPINNRQTLGAIEDGSRNIRGEELAAAARVLGVQPDFFTDRFSAAGEAVFSFRAEAAGVGELDEFETQAGCWIATYRELGAESGEGSSLLNRSLSLTRRSSYEEAMEAGEEVGRELRLGTFPARGLQAALEREWGVLVLHADTPSGISGAASRLDGLWTIIINRNEPSGRRSYDLAHELFHLLTWDAMEPRRIDSTTPARGDKRVEQLANKFASALLMPERTVRARWEAREDRSLHDWISLVAGEFTVSGPALKWRLCNLGLVDSDELPDHSELLQLSDGNRDSWTLPQLFNASFVERVYTAVESGVLSLRRASSLLGLDSAGFAALCRSYGRQLSYEI